LATHGGHELGDHTVLVHFDLLVTLRELGEQSLGHTSNPPARPPGVAPGPRLPAHAQRLGEIVRKNALVYLGESYHGLVEIAAIEAP
jgi:hypothetical protein